MEALPDDSSPPAASTPSAPFAPNGRCHCPRMHVRLDNPHLLVTARHLKDHGGRAASARKRSELATGRPQCDLHDRLERSIL
jgi:hypothetical protein